MVTISMYNNKGGVCKSTTILMLSQYFCSLGLKVLVIDMDPSSNSTHYFFKKKNGSQREFRKTIKNLLDPTDPTSKLASVIYKSERVDNLYVVPSEFDLDLTELMLARKSPSNELELKMVLKEALDEYKENPSPRFPVFDIVFMDLHPSRRSMLNYNALIASDYVFLPCDRDIETIEGLGSCISVIKEMQQFNPSLSLGGVIYVKYKAGKVDHTRAMPELMNAFKDTDECQLLESVIPYVNEQDELRWTRRTLFSGRTSRKAEKLTDAYQKLGDEILDIVEGGNER